MRKYRSIKGKMKKKKQELGVKLKAEENKSKVHPMAYSILAKQISEGNSNDFIKNSFEVLDMHPERLTDKWIASLNRFVKSYAEKACLDEPEQYKEGNRYTFYMKIHSIKDNDYGTKNFVCKDKNGWSYWGRSGCLGDNKEGDFIAFTGKVSAHKEGITFLSRVRIS